MNKKYYTFIILILLANVIAWPIAYKLIDVIMREYAYKTDIGFAVYLSSTIIMLAISIVAISYQCFKTAYSNPIEAIKYE